MPHGGHGAEGAGDATRKGRPHGGHEAEDRRRPARGDQGGPWHRHARPPRGRRAVGRRDVGHGGRRARRRAEGRRGLTRTPPRTSTAPSALHDQHGTNSRDRGARRPGPSPCPRGPDAGRRCFPGALSGPGYSVAAVTSTSPSVVLDAHPPDVRTAAEPLAGAWRSAEVVALALARRPQQPEPGDLAGAVAGELGLDLAAVLAAEKATGRAGEVTR